MRYKHRILRFWIYAMCFLENDGEKKDNNKNYSTLDRVRIEFRFFFLFFFLINSDCYWWIKFVDGRGFRSSLCSLFLWSLQSFSSLTGLKSSLQSVNFLAHIHICILSIYECIRLMYVIKVSFSDGRDLWMINMEVYLRTF